MKFRKGMEKVSNVKCEYCKFDVHETTTSARGDEGYALHGSIPICT